MRTYNYTVIDRFGRVETKAVEARNIRAAAVAIRRVEAGSLALAVGQPRPVKSESIRVAD